MAILQSRNDNSGLFDIVLPEHATPEQIALKRKLDVVTEVLGHQRNEPSFAAHVESLQALAQQGFGEAIVNPGSAIDQADALLKSITRPDPDKPPPPRRGAFRVTLPDPTKESDRNISWREIIFNVTGDVVPPPPEQIKLKNEIETTLTTLQLMFPDKSGVLHPTTYTVEQRRYADYQNKLLGIAQTGLQTPADPQSAQDWLQSLQADIVGQEGPRKKNSYMISLGIAALVMAGISSAIYLIMRNNPELSKLIYAFRNLFVLWTGTMIGTWLSFGIRRAKITFKDLGAMEDDMVEPGIRLIFTGLIAITIGFIFICGMVTVSVGSLSSQQLLGQGRSALLIGMLLGVSELALPSALTRRASQFVSEIAGKS